MSNFKPPVEKGYIRLRYNNSSKGGKTGKEYVYNEFRITNEDAAKITKSKYILIEKDGNRVYFKDGNGCRKAKKLNHTDSRTAYKLSSPNESGRPIAPNGDYPLKYDEEHGYYIELPTIFDSKISCIDNIKDAYVEYATSYSSYNNDFISHLALAKKTSVSAIVNEALDYYRKAHPRLDEAVKDLRRISKMDSVNMAKSQ